MERDDTDGTRVLDYLASVLTAVSVLDGVDTEGDESATVEHAPLHGGLDEVFVSHQRSIGRPRCRRAWTAALRWVVHHLRHRPCVVR